MKFDHTKPFTLNDGSPAEFVRQTAGEVIRVRVPKGHPLDQPGYDRIRTFNVDGTRNGVGAAPPLDYYLVNVIDLPTEAEWERILIDTHWTKAIAELRTRNLIKPAPVDPVVKLAREIQTHLNPQADEDDTQKVADMIRAAFPEGPKA